MTPSRPPAPPALPHWAFWGWLVTLAVVTRPFRGVFHDGELYAAQALRRLDDDGWNDDMFFAFGNQDSFTVFTRFYAPAIDILGLSGATWLFWAAGLIFWLLALVFMAHRIFDTRRDAQIAAFGAICLYAGYGNGLFTYGEGYVTPRIWAEALCMVSIGAVLANRMVGAAIAGLAALILHPLLALSGVCLAFWLACPRKRHFLTVAVLAVASGLLLAALGIAPFDWMLQQIDAEWWQIVRAYIPGAFVGDWWALMIFIWLPLPLLSLLLVWRHGTPRQRDLVTGTLLIGAGFTAASFILVDLAANRFFAAIQLWRAGLWVALLGNLFAGAALSTLPRHALSRKLFVAALGLTALCAPLGIPPLTAGLIALSAATMHIAERSGSVRLLSPFGMAGALLLLAALLSAPALLLTIAANGTGTHLFWQFAVAAVVALGVWSLLSSPSHRTTIILLIGLAISLISADKRSDRQVMLAQADALPAEIAALSQGKTLYWEGEIVTAWFGLRRSHYYACRHKSGILFHRAQAIEFQRRADALRRLETEDFMPLSGHACPARAEEDETGTSLKSVCAALPGLDLVALRRELDHPRRAGWTVPFADTEVTSVPVWFRISGNIGATTYYVYACEDVE